MYLIYMTFFYIEVIINLLYIKMNYILSVFYYNAHFS